MSGTQHDMQAGVSPSGVAHLAGGAPGIGSGPGGGVLTHTDLAELLGAFNDVTEKLRASHDRLHAQVQRLTAELREANEQVERSRRLAALGEMAAGIAHEVRNPLGSIRLYARMLEQDLAQQPAQRELAGKITGATRVVEGIVSDVLSFAREVRLRPEALDGAEVLRRAWEACAAEGAALPGLEVRLPPEKGDAPVVWGDSALLHQALVNVMTNAIQAMRECPAPAGGHRLGLSVRKQRRALRAGEPRAEAVSLAVRDTGPGVTSEVRERMFNPFFTTRAAGTGLGLAIVHRIVEAHAGAVRVANHSDKDTPRPASGEGWERGACVELVLPARRFSGATGASAEVVVRSGLQELRDAQPITH